MKYITLNFLAWLILHGVYDTNHHQKIVMQLVFKNTSDQCIENCNKKYNKKTF